MNLNYNCDGKMTTLVYSCLEKNLLCDHFTWATVSELYWIFLSLNFILLSKD